MNFTIVKSYAEGSAVGGACNRDLLVPREAYVKKNPRGYGDCATNGRKYDLLSRTERASLGKKKKKKERNKQRLQL